jgi:hypothetical protein
LRFDENRDGIDGGVIEGRKIADDARAPGLPRRGADAKLVVLAWTASGENADGLAARQ